MKKIPVKLTNKKASTFALVDDEDFDTLSKIGWFSRDGYAAYTKREFVGGPPVTVLMHRLVMRAKKGQTIDHINRNKLDNRKQNLRFCSQMENTWNTGKRVTATSGHQGVSWHKASQAWRARIQTAGKRIELGSFGSKEEASLAYENMKSKLRPDPRS